MKNIITTIRPCLSFLILSVLVLTASCRQRTEQDVAAGSGEPQEQLVVFDDEPNDSLSTASVLGEGGRGTLSPGDVDLYELVGRPGLWEIRALANNPHALRIDVISSIEELPASEQSNGVIHAVAGREGVFLAVRGVAAAAGEEVVYAIELSPVAPAIQAGPILLEPTSPAAPFQAASLEEAILSGFFDGTADRDAIFLEGGAFSGLNAVDISLSLPADSLGMLRVSAAGGTVPLVELSSPTPGAMIRLPNLSVQSFSGGVLIEIWDALSNSSPEPYHIMVQPTQGENGILELEPNDTAESAGRLINGQVVHGYLHKQDDLDFYTYDVEAGAEGMVVLSVEPDPATSLEIRWSTPGSGARLVDLVTEAPGQALDICPLYPEAGMQLLEVATTAPVTSSMGSYSLTLNRLEGNYEHEPNGVASPYRIPVGLSEVQGFISPSGDVDVFQWHYLPAIDLPTQIIELFPAPHQDLGLRILDDAGGEILRQDRHGEGAMEMASADLPPGLYRIEITGSISGGCDTPYRLRIRNDSTQ